MGDNNNSKGEWWNWDPKFYLFNLAMFAEQFWVLHQHSETITYRILKVFLSILRENIS